MTHIQINTAKPYTVSIGKGISEKIGQIIQQLTKAEKICIVSDEHIWPFYGSKIMQQLSDCKMDISEFIVPAGESSKNLTTYGNLLDFLAEKGISRDDCIIAFGGGVVGDLAGFAAATYLRGIPYMQIPTTLLAMVDSSVGGKTAIDLPSGKNLAGAFYQPIAVLCDPDLLSSLPEDVFQDGCAEVIKYGILYDEELFFHLEQYGRYFNLETVIARCVELKRNAVEQDEFDKGSRMLLNLGHTIGHAIELCSQYTISHGKAVAIGIAIVSRASQCGDSRRICALLEQFELPISSVYSAEQLACAAMADKKRSGSSINLIIPYAIGDCQIVPTSVNELPAFIEKGL